VVGSVYKRLSWVAIPFVLAVLLPDGARAFVLNWGASTWTAGTPTAATPVSQIFTTSNASVNVKITISEVNGGSGAPTWTTATVAGVAPGISFGTTLTPGGYNALITALSADPLGSYVQVAVSFVLSSNNSTLVPVTSVSTNIFDVDMSATAGGNNYTDKISNVLGTTSSGGTVGVSSTTHGSDNTVNGTGTATTDTGTVNIGGGGANNDGNSTGNFGFSYGNQAVTGFSFQWANSVGTTGNGTNYQFIALDNINFLIVPEIGPGIAALLLCFGAAALQWYRVRRA